MTRLYSFKDVVNDVNSGNYDSFMNSEFMRGSWGIGAHQGGYLVADRCQEGDPKRDGQIVFPGSRRFEGESVYNNARRVVKKETGVSHFQPIGLLVPDTKFENGVAYAKATDNSVVLILPDGTVQMFYHDSGKAYHFNPVVGHFEGKTPEPHEVKLKLSGAKNPRFMMIEEMFSSDTNFTDACRVPLEVIKSVHEGKLITNFKYTPVKEYPIMLNFAPFAKPK